jgi:hypothetical protein
LAAQLRSVPAVAINNVRKHQISLRKWNLVKLSAVDCCNVGRWTDNLELVLQSCIIKCLFWSTQSVVTSSSSEALPWPLQIYFKLSLMDFVKFIFLKHKSTAFWIVC